ncbi:class I SAM-dependent methyltransferase [Parerythrobacter aurantius]|uniref:class I SAM-dependent methyltransferase n=1 Tax=Parerythrobacter aurantius TaxID=3127706 RepID=UPI0032444C8C
MSENQNKAWGDFWARQQARGGGGCLPDGWGAIEAAQRAVWTRFAQDLPQECRVLDLATGDGRVMGWLKEARPDIAVEGVDLAPQLPDPPAGTTSTGGVPMEELPFPDAAFGAVVSQFGFEYSRIELTAGEIARVLQPGGRAALLTHRLDGPIMAHNCKRRMQIGWLFDRKSLFAVAQRTLEARGHAFAATPAAIGEIVTEASQRFGPQSAAWEIAEAVRRTLVMPGTVPAGQIAQTLDLISEQARNEIGRIDSLEGACRVTADEFRLAQAFTRAGLRPVSQEQLGEEGGKEPFADFRIQTTAT